MAELDGRWVTMNGSKVFLSNRGDVIMGLGKSYHLKELNYEQIVDLLERHLQDYKDEFTESVRRRGNGVMAILGDELGASQLPELITEEQLEKEVADGGTELWRGFGYEGSQYAEQFKTGELYYGKGVYGDGTYTTIDKDTAMTYADYRQRESSMAHMVLKPDAKITSWQTLIDDYSNETTRGALLDIMKKRHPYGDTNLNYFVHSVTRDGGCLGLLNGYDAVFVEDKKNQESDYYIILNRGSVKVVR